MNCVTGTVHFHHDVLSDNIIIIGALGDNSGVMTLYLSVTPSHSAMVYYKIQLSQIQNSLTLLTPNMSLFYYKTVGKVGKIIPPKKKSNVYFQTG